MLAASLAMPHAGAQTLELEPGRPQHDLAEFARHVELPGNPDETLPQALALPPAVFEPIGTQYIDFGQSPNTIWLRFELHNSSASAGEWLLSLNVRSMSGVLAYLGAESGDVLFRQTPGSNFDERPLPHRILAVPLSLTAGERTTLLVGYRSRGSTALPLSIETPASHAARYAWEDAVNLAAYVAVSFMIILSVLQAFAFREPTQFAYAFYLAATLAYILHLDGVTFQYLWPQSPEWNSYAAIPSGLIMSIAALTFARSFTETNRIAPVYDRVMFGVIVVAAVACFGGLVASEAALKTFAYVIASSTAGLCLGAGVVAYLRKRPSMRFFVLGWVGVFAGVALTSIVSNFPALVPRTTALAIPKITIVFDTLMFYLALADRSRQWRIERDRAMRRELEAMQKHQRVAERLHDAERERLEALLVAQTKGRQLAMASHDIRQPLTSLRLMLERLAGMGNMEQMTVGFRQSLDYLDGLSREYATDPSPGGAVHSEAPRAEDDVFDVRTLFVNIDLMFRDEACAKGLDFRCRARPAELRGDAMATMRIVSNLVANAIKYTRKGKILVGCRRRKHAATVVVADTGPGIPADELDRVLDVHQRGSTAAGTEGEGLGLGIARALALKHGYGFRCRSTPGRGTVFFLDVPTSRHS